MKNKYFKKNIVRMTLIISLLWIGVSCPQKVLGEENEGVGFSYYNHAPKNQIAEGGYFDLLVEPGTEQTLITEISNESAEEMTVKININDATTAETGIIEYGPSSLKGHSEREHSLSDILNGPEEVTLKKGETKRVAFKLTVPTKPFKGVLLGGIQLEKKMAKHEGKNALSIQNKYAYVFSVSLREEKAKSKIDLSSTESLFVLTNDGGQVNVMITNNSPEIISEMNLAAAVTRKGKKAVLVETALENVKMAPMSVMAYPIDLDQLEPGKYLTETTAKIGKKEWRWIEEFEIKKTENKVGIKNQTVNQSLTIKLGTVIAIVLILVAGTIVLFITIKLYQQK